MKNEMTEKRLNELKKMAHKELNEMIDFYNEDPENRLAVKDDICIYYDKDTGNKCAVGRILPEEIIEKLKLHENKEYLTCGIYSLMHAFNIELINELSINFWALMQNIHDDNCNWDFDKKCLSEQGENQVLMLQEKINHCSISNHKFLTEKCSR